MPHLITRQEAVSKIEKEIPQGECLACHILKEQVKYILKKGKYTTTLLSEYPRCWGQVIVITNRHITSFTELKPKEWIEMSNHVLSASKVVEQVLKPLRCYVSATGAYQNMVSTTPHLHFNIVPIYNKTDKPATIFTWANGLYSGTNEEWEELHEKLKKAWSLQTHT